MSMAGDAEVVNAALPIPVPISHVQVQTREPSRLKTVDADADVLWDTAPEYHQSCPGLVADKFMQVTDLLLENPNLNSTHLFRADILLDSERRLQTVAEKGKGFHVSPKNDDEDADGESRRDDDAREGFSSEIAAPALHGAILERKVLRRLIPRKPQLDRALDQWCYIYRLVGDADTDAKDADADPVSGHVVVYVPDIKNEADVPWYHPPVKALAYLYERKGNEAFLSIHFLPLNTPSSGCSLPTRVHRTFISLLHTFLRLAKNPDPQHNSVNSASSANSTVNVNGDLAAISLATFSLAPSALKDTILPQHIVQDTYSRLKQRHAQDLISRWVEKTEPTKHVFEDLSIAAFVIELWKHMYPAGTEEKKEEFPGFVDIACGNGVLTYVLIKEGYKGRGFDARRRATWDALELHDHLDEMICVPQPFLDAVKDAASRNDESNGGGNPIIPPNIKIHNGIFPPGTFIISNHADELTPWTPLLATLSCPENPLPFLAIPCCSHALSGARNRYTVKDIIAPTPTGTGAGMAISSDQDPDKDQPATGDLKALRAAKLKAAAHHPESTSTYACLTKKVVSLALEVEVGVHRERDSSNGDGVDSDVQVTLLRIPSTRNIGVVGNRQRQQQQRRAAQEGPYASARADQVRKKIQAVIERECASTTGGVHGAAREWISRARALQGIGARRRLKMAMAVEMATGGETGEEQEQEQEEGH